MARIGQNSLKKMLMISKTYVFCTTQIYPRVWPQLVFGQKISPKKLTPLCRPKNGQNWPKWPQKDVNDIKNFCFLHHASHKPSLEYGLNQFLAKNSAIKN
jgi:hypothetical protein